MYYKSKRKNSDEEVTEILNHLADVVFEKN
jgi:hypothetical protein